MSWTDRLKDDLERFQEEQENEGDFGRTQRLRGKIEYIEERLLPAVEEAVSPDQGEEEQEASEEASEEDIAEEEE